MKFQFFNKLYILYKYKLIFNLNKYKFKDIFLKKLCFLIEKFYKKKVEFNIIKLRSLTFNTDIFTEILKLKLKKRRFNVLKVINFILSKGYLPRVNRIKEKAAITKIINSNYLENKFNNLTLSNIIKDNNLEKVLKDSFNTFSSDIQRIFFNNIKYKNLGGIRLEIKGRLTRRYRADRSIFKLR
jgi:hypothetical protein